MHTTHGPWRLRSSGAHCNPELGAKVGDEDWREGWRRELARRLAKRMGEEEKEDGRGGEGGRAALIKSSNPHLAGGELSKSEIQRFHATHL